MYAKQLQTTGENVHYCCLISACIKMSFCKFHFKVLQQTVSLINVNVTRGTKKKCLDVEERRISLLVGDIELTVSSLVSIGRRKWIQIRWTTLYNAATFLQRQLTHKWLSEAHLSLCRSICVYDIYSEVPLTVPMPCTSHSL